MRTINVGGNQGRGDPLAAPDDESPGMAVSRTVWLSGIACGALYIFAWWALS